MTYLPFLDGKYSTAPGLYPLAKATPVEQRVFQLDEEYPGFIANKQRCREEEIRKYYVEQDLFPGTAATVNRFIVRRLVEEHPQDFSPSGERVLVNTRTGARLEWEADWINVAGGRHLSLFDALCSQVQEDMAICQLEEERDWLAAIHLMAPNHWSPAEKIGKPFGSVHGVVPGMEKLNQQYFRMLVTAVQKGPFVRFAWGISTDRRLNHHPLAPPGVDTLYWQGRRIADGGTELYIRTERQTITGMPECNAFLFTIRTYFYAVDELSVAEKQALLSAVEGMSAASLEYKGLTGAAELLRVRFGAK